MHILGFGRECIAAGQVYSSSGLPGPFANLYRLKFGAMAIIHAYGQKYIFDVQAIWRKDGTYRRRLVVRAVLVKVEGK